jgi:hypothetical protein
MARVHPLVSSYGGNTIFDSRYLCIGTGLGAKVFLTDRALSRPSSRWVMS